LRPQVGDKSLEYYFFFQLRNILHTDDVRIGFSNDPTKSRKQPPLVEFALLLASCVSGKRLAGSATDQNLGVIGGKETCDFETGKMRDIFFNKKAPIVFLVGISTFRVCVYTSANGDAFFQKTVSQSADATEHVNGGYRLLGM
jgi:hypothetical protein